MKKALFLLSAILLMALSPKATAAGSQETGNTESSITQTPPEEIGDGYFDESKGLEFAKWVRAHVVFPEGLKEDEVHGRINAQFSVKEDGTIFNVKILKGLYPELDAEVKRVILSSPKWKTTHSDLITTTFATYSIPVVFK